MRIENLLHINKCYIVVTNNKITRAERSDTKCFSNLNFQWYTHLVFNILFYSLHT